MAEIFEGDIYTLTDETGKESEFELIKNCEKGTCLYRCGNERYLLQVKSPNYKSKLYGKAGGR